jgi:methionyl-tRNA formyltransferase
VNVVVLTRNPHGIASRFLARRPGPVILDEAVGRRDVRRTLRKLRRVGLTAAPVGLVLRRAYADAGDVAAVEDVATEVVRVPTLNGDEARDALRRLGADLAISLDNTIIRPETFGVPAHGTINVHHGAVPDYRGGPPVFWELSDGLDRVGFTIHLIDAGIDTGPVLARGDVPIERRATLAQTLVATIPRLHEASLDALEAVLDAAAFEGERQPSAKQHRTTPTLGDYLRVRRSLRD